MRTSLNITAMKPNSIELIYFPSFFVMEVKKENLTEIYIHSIVSFIRNFHILLYFKDVFQ